MKMSLNLLLFSMIGCLTGSESLEQLLYKAISQSDADQVEALLAAGADPKKCHSLLHLCKAPLDYAFTIEDVIIAKALIQYKTDCNSRITCSNSPLRLLIRHECTNAMWIASLLLKAGAQVNCLDREKRSLLYKAVEWTNLAFVKLVLSYDVDEEHIHSSLYCCMEELNSRRDRISSWVAKEKKILLAIEHKLITKGIRKKYLQQRLDQSLSDACFFDLAHAVELLLEAGADPNGRDFVRFPLFLRACQHSGVEILQMFLNAGADLTCKDSSGNGALHEAVMGNNKEVVQFLLSNPQKREELTLLAGLFE